MTKLQKRQQQQRRGENSAVYKKVMHLREKSHGKKDFKVVADGSSLEDTFIKGTYYLDTIDSKWRCTYKRFI
ncbi:hypothetical protein Glove_227g56 [Diversispora epigaea]|uniref:Hydroxymethylglutaryl-coenzyme A synthase C-terminal domain-containing protein n=1 Tax=Diversispora epigaea TaxID=1348612 RepID=A0A397IIX7_9GLOM|nr:hypothetical protein Glove_227g56 [Diversispora epigaea]